ncbi:MAG: T9SS type A sorting domain-containing protein [Bacteroidota bacterium]
MQNSKSAFLFSFLLLLFLSPTYAQISFLDARVIYSLPGDSNIPLDAGELADFTGDNRVDYLFTLTEFGTSDLFLLEQDTEGEFQLTTLNEEVSTVVQIADFDGDDDQDFLGISSVFLNSGANDFQEAESGFPVITESQERLLYGAADLNGDDLLDYATGSNQSVFGDSLFVYFGMPEGGFQVVGVPAVDAEIAGSYNLFGNFQSVAPTGILAVAEDHVTIYNTTNTDLVQVATLNDSRIDDKAGAIGDVDGDGDNDVVLAGLFSGIYLWEQEADGYANSLVTVSSTAQRVLSMELVDIEGDGDLDLVTIGGPNALQVAVYENQGGTLSSAGQIFYTRPLQSSFFFAFGNAFENLIEIADIDNDSDPDVVVFDYENDQIVVLENVSMPSSLWSPIAPAETLRAFPNPSLGQVQISYPERVSAPQWKNVQLIDQNGRVLRQWMELPQNIDLSHLPAGEYVLSATTMDQRQFIARLVRVTRP